MQRINPFMHFHDALNNVHYIHTGKLGTNPIWFTYHVFLTYYIFFMCKLKTVFPTALLCEMTQMIRCRKKKESCLPCIYVCVVGLGCFLGFLGFLGVRVTSSTQMWECLLWHDESEESRHAFVISHRLKTNKILINRGKTCLVSTNLNHSF